MGCAWRKADALMENPGERGFLQPCNLLNCLSLSVNGRSSKVQSLVIISAKPLLNLEWFFLSSLL